MRMIAFILAVGLALAAGSGPLSAQGTQVTFGAFRQDTSLPVELAADRLSVTFRLRPGARFSNGDPVTAEDVKAVREKLIK